MTNTVISSNNRKISKIRNNNGLASNENILNRKCNCRIPRNCPLDGKSLTSEIVYKCEIKTDNTKKIYLGATGTVFKDRYRKHVVSFKKEPGIETYRDGVNDSRVGTKISIRNTNKKKNTIALGDWIRERNRYNENFELKWSVVDSGGSTALGNQKGAIYVY